MKSTSVSSIRVLSADDHTIVRTGVQMLLQLRFGIKQFYEASSCADLLTAIREHRPTHLIIDMIFKDGNSLEILPTLVQLFPDLKVMGYSMLPSDIYEPVLRKLGVGYYLHKGSSQEQIEYTLQRFLFDPASLQMPIASAETGTANPFAQLSQRELEVLHYLLRGDAISGIATQLNLHKNTVSTLKARIFEKTTVNSYKELLELAALHQINVSG